MLARVYTIFKRQSFRPSFWSILINPFFLVRRAIYRSVQRNAKMLQGNILDFGCGGKPYKHLFEVAKYTGIDVLQPGHNHELEEVDVYYNGRDIPFASETFDGCFSSQVFEHIFDLDFSLQEIHRVLKPGAKCLFIVPFVWDEHEVPYDFGRYSAFGIAYLLKKHGFSIIRKEKDSHFAEVLAQLFCLYLYNILDTKNRYFNVLLCAAFVFPFSLLGWILKTLAPRSNKLYFNNVLVVQRE